MNASLCLKLSADLFEPEAEMVARNLNILGALEVAFERGRKRPPVQMTVDNLLDPCS